VSNPDTFTGQAPRILVVFSSVDGETEKRALAGGVGAVQARALIRLRRVRDPDEESLRSGSETYERMQKEYVPPTLDDVTWADGVIFCPTAGLSRAWADFLDLLGVRMADGGLDGKVAVVASDPGHPLAIAASLLRYGFIVLPPVLAASDPIADSRVQGRRLAMIAGALKHHDTSLKGAQALFG
jgi:hypothetical protein